MFITSDVVFLVRCLQAGPRTHRYTRGRQGRLKFAGFVCSARVAMASRPLASATRPRPSTSHLLTGTPCRASLHAGAAPPWLDQLASSTFLGRPRPSDWPHGCLTLAVVLHITTSDLLRSFVAQVRPFTCCRRRARWPPPLASNVIGQSFVADFSATHHAVALTSPPCRAGQHEVSNGPQSPHQPGAPHAAAAFPLFRAISALNGCSAAAMPCLASRRRLS